MSQISHLLTKQFAILTRITYLVQVFFRLVSKIVLEDGLVLKHTQEILGHNRSKTSAFYTSK